MDASFECCSTPSLWHIDAVGGRPPHHPSQASGTSALWRNAFDANRLVADVGMTGVVQAMDINAALQTLSGKAVSAKTMLGNTVEVWLDVAPRAANAIVFQVDPPWRIVRSDGIIATSAEIPWEPEVGESRRDYRARCEAAWKVSDILVGITLEDAMCNQSTGDLTLKFQDGLCLQCFTVWRDEPQWNLRLFAQNRRVGFKLDEAI